MILSLNTYGLNLIESNIIFLKEKFRFNLYISFDQSILIVKNRISKNTI